MRFSDNFNEYNRHPKLFEVIDQTRQFLTQNGLMQSGLMSFPQLINEPAVSVVFDLKNSQIHITAKALDELSVDEIMYVVKYHTYKSQLEAKNKEAFKAAINTVFGLTLLSFISGVSKGPLAPLPLILSSLSMALFVTERAITTIQNHTAAYASDEKLAFEHPEVANSVLEKLLKSRIEWQQENSWMYRLGGSLGKATGDVRAAFNDHNKSGKYNRQIIEESVEKGREIALKAEEHYRQWTNKLTPTESFRLKAIEKKLAANQNKALEA